MESGHDPTTLTPLQPRDFQDIPDDEFTPQARPQLVETYRLSLPDLHQLALEIHDFYKQDQPGYSRDPLEKLVGELLLSIRQQVLAQTYRGTTQRTGYVAMND